MTEKIICVNRKARHDYHIEETIEAGLALVGTEVKSLRAGRANIKDSYAKIKSGELFLVNSHINEYDFGNRNNHDPLRDRKLLLHKREIKKLIGKITEKGKTIVPLKMYFKLGKAKIEIAIASGKRQYDKRETIKKKDMQRDIERGFRKGNKY
ncbi:MAG: SsrA-binding protein SmpB [Pseudomonadota bacterium]